MGVEEGSKTCSNGLEFQDGKCPFGETEMEVERRRMCYEILKLLEKVVDDVMNVQLRNFMIIGNDGWNCGLEEAQCTE